MALGFPEVLEWEPSRKIDRQQWAHKPNMLRNGKLPERSSTKVGLASMGRRHGSRYGIPKPPPLPRCAKARKDELWTCAQSPPEDGWPGPKTCPRRPQELRGKPPQRTATPASWAARSSGERFWSLAAASLAEAAPRRPEEPADASASRGAVPELSRAGEAAGGGGSIGAPGPRANTRWRLSVGPLALRESGRRRAPLRVRPQGPAGERRRGSREAFSPSCHPSLPCCLPSFVPSFLPCVHPSILASLPSSASLRPQSPQNIDTMRPRGLTHPLDNTSGLQEKMVRDWETRQRNGRQRRYKPRRSPGRRRMLNVQAGARYKWRIARAAQDHSRHDKAFRGCPKP